MLSAVLLLNLDNCFVTILFILDIVYFKLELYFDIFL